MAASAARFGLSCALATPFEADGGVSLARLIAHARRCLDGGCDSVTVFGTTGEGASLGLTARERVLGALDAAGIALAHEVVGGVAASSVEEAAIQYRALVKGGCRAVLLAPAFYFKGVTDAGVFAWFAALFERLGADARDAILYNIPSVTGVALSVELVGQLREAFPEIVVGVKDSSGDWPFTQRLLEAHRDLAILVGDERTLGAARRLGADGSICGFANIEPGAMRAILDDARDDPRVRDAVDAILALPVMPAVKALVAHRTGDPGWAAVAPPLMPLDPAAARRLTATVDGLFATRAA